MASVKVIYKKDKQRKNGNVPLYIRIIHNRKAKFIAMGVDVHPDHWDEENLRVRKSYRNSQRLNNFIAQKIAEAEQVALDLEEKEETDKNARIRELLNGKPVPDFFEYAQKFLDRLNQQGKVSRFKRVRSSINKVKAFHQKAKLPLDQITVTFLKAFEEHLQEEIGNATNTIHSDLKIIRKLFNDAIAEDLIPYEKNPFIRYKLKWEKTQKEYLSEEELAALEAFPLKPNTKRYHHRNMYVFSCYAGGLRISDILQLRWVNFDGERITLKIKKTNEQHSFKLPKRALEILQEYQTEDSEPMDFIFPIFKSEKDYSDPRTLHNSISSANAYCNKDLRFLAGKLGVSHTMSFHSARHTWATRALRKGMRIEYVSKIMGHASIKTTQIYAKIVNSELDKAMEVFDEEE